ncbi:hypothetical protein M1466_00080 [Candidatus Dependentiae bacterium]|nr:hypothetical protein [Candidatus Dependentiae bacterium]
MKNYNKIGALYLLLNIVGSAQAMSGELAPVHVVEYVGTCDQCNLLALVHQNAKPYISYCFDAQLSDDAPLNDRAGLIIGIGSGVTRAIQTIIVGNQTKLRGLILVSPVNCESAFAINLYGEIGFDSIPKKLPVLIIDAHSSLESSEESKSLYRQLCTLGGREIYFVDLQQQRLSAQLFSTTTEELPAVLHSFFARCKLPCKDDAAMRVERFIARFSPSCQELGIEQLPLSPTGLAINPFGTSVSASPMRGSPLVQLMLGGTPSPRSYAGSPAAMPSPGVTRKVRRSLSDATRPNASNK